MKTTRVTLGLAAVLCFLFLLPAQASAGGIFQLSIGGHISTCSNRRDSHHHWRHGRRTWRRNPHRWLLGRRYESARVSCRGVLHRDRPVHSSVVVVKTRPACGVVEVCRKPGVKIERYRSRRVAYKRLVKKIEVVHR
ncbi:MAG: hypothetical protein ACYTBJ_12645 [Planctomycetota bacterium]